MQDKDRFIAITDTHIRITPPESRVEDDFLNVALGKLSFIFNIAKTQKTNAILHSGDMFDRPDSSAKILSKCIALIKDQCPCDFLVVPGNHDSFGEFEGGYKDTSLGVLEEAGCIQVLSNGAACLYDHTTILGFGWNEPTTEELLAGTYNPRSYCGNGFYVEYANLIGLIHAGVGGPDYMFAQSIEKQNIKGLDLALFGDIHAGFEEYVMADGCRALSLGSFVRMKVTENHTPSFAIIESDTTGIKYKKFPVPSKPYSEAFNPKMVDRASADGFIEFIREAKNRSGETIDDFVKRICDKYRFPSKVGDIVLEALKGEIHE